MLAGYTYNPASGDPDTQAAAAIRQDGYIGGGRTPAEQVQKVFLGGTDRPTSISAKWQQMISAGIKLVLSVEPGNPGNTADKTWLDGYLAKLKAAGAVCDIVLWSEPISNPAFPTAASFIAWFRYYAATVRAYYPVVYDPNFNFGTHTLVAAWYPGDAYVDKIMVDSYTNSYRQSSKATPPWRWADVVEPIADAAVPPKPFGVAEWGFGQPGSPPITAADFNNYAGFIAAHFAARLAAGKPCADVLFFGSPGAPGASGVDDILASRSFATASVASGSATITDSGASFGAADVGRAVSTANVPYPGTTIASVTDASHAVMSAAATATSGPQACTIEDFKAWGIRQVYDAVNAASAGPGATLLGSATAGSSTTSAVITATAASAPGEAIVVAGCINSLTLPNGAVPCTDSHGNTYSLAKSANAQNPAGWVYICQQPATPIAIGDTITVTWSSATASKGIYAVAVAGANTRDGTLTGATGQGVSTSPSASTGTLAQTGEVAVAMLASQDTGGVPTGLPGTGWTQLGSTIDTGNHRLVLLAQNAPSTAALTAAETLPISTNWTVIVLPLKAAALLTVTTTTLPPGMLTQAYSASLAASGGTAPYTWAATGTLPPGLSLSAAGVLSGTPTTAGSYPVTFTVTDAAARAASVTITVTIVAAMSVTTASPLPGGTTGTPYGVTLAATGGQAPYAWASTAGSVAPGLGLSAAGVLAGTPLTTGTFTFTAQVTGSNGFTATKPLAVTITAGVLAVATESLAAASAGAPYTATLAATGGTPPYTWAVT